MTTSVGRSSKRCDNYSVLNDRLVKGLITSVVGRGLRTGSEVKCRNITLSLINADSLEVVEGKRGCRSQEGADESVGQ